MTVARFTSLVLATIGAIGCGETQHPPSPSPKPTRSQPAPGPATKLSEADAIALARGDYTDQFKEHTEDKTEMVWTKRRVPCNQIDHDTDPFHTKCKDPTPTAPFGYKEVPEQKPEKKSVNVPAACPGKPETEGEWKGVFDATSGTWNVMFVTKTTHRSRSWTVNDKTKEVHRHQAC